MDITQYVLFVLFLVVGLVAVAAPPWLSAMIPDVTGWHVAVAVLGSIVLSRLLLAPYWLWQDERRRAEEAEARVVRTGEHLPRSIRYEPAGVGRHNGAISGINLQVGNTSSAMLQVSLERAVVTFGSDVSCQTQQGAPQYLSGGETTIFSLAAPVGLKPETDGEVVAEFVYDDVPPRGPRRSRLKYRLPLRGGGYCGEIVMHEEF